MNAWLLCSLALALVIYAGIKLFRRYDPDRQKKQDAEDIRYWEKIRSRGFLRYALIKHGGFFIPYFYFTAAGQALRESSLFVPPWSLVAVNMAVGIPLTFLTAWSGWSGARERAEEASARSKT